MRMINKSSMVVWSTKEGMFFIIISAFILLELTIFLHHELENNKEL